MFKFRDLTIFDISPELRMVISCDSSGGIGDKERDVVKVDPEVLGYFTTQVALMELVATGSKPISIINTLGVEMNETGKRIIEGIKRAIKPLNMNEDIMITGSTEENIPVCQTSMGITIVGLIEKSKWRVIKAEKNDVVVAIGIPKVGNELASDMSEFFSLDLMLELINKPYVKDILPVGSKGIAYELGVMASTNGLKYELAEKIEMDINKTAGPATCALIAIDREGYEDLKESVSIPLNIIAKLY
ncbi:AIR synthase related protein [Tissierella sp. Yu-01]|uniref:AIR synthase related protein n=1 Tax=Tissierella sp. Yu-01 TaxID=3035694 RepID=UPI00240CFD65|nr:AIR synthase related protein [Tissierella sp. Yu-01]WFA10020.1 selenophosphate synthase [Tissierella sp. Yu-01]